MISANLTYLRKYYKYSQEYLAEKSGVSRQAVAKWESGETVPDLENCIALASLYNVTLDNLVHYNSERADLPIAPKGKHAFGTVTVGDRGQIVIPKKARDIFDIKTGDSLMVLGDEEQGIAIVKTDIFLSVIRDMMSKGEK